MPPAAMRGFRTLAAVTALAAAPAHAQYTWEALPLHPSGAISSQAFAASRALQGGYIKFDLGLHPVVWSGSSGEYVDLLPAGRSTGQVLGMDGQTQVGNTGPRAALWRGSAESYVDLQPAGMGGSNAYAVAGDMQVGYANSIQTGYPHAGLWRGTAASFVDLHPSGAEWSEAFATDGEFQGGWAALSGEGTHAVLWSGSASSMVDLNPEGARESVVRAMAEGVQAGSALFGVRQHAILWRGSADSDVDLNPPGALDSLLYGTDGKHHAGAAVFASLPRAGVWLSDGPASFVDLHGLLGPGYASSWASSVAVHGSELHVSGFALSTAGPYEAWLWVGTVPAPGAAPALLTGLTFACKRRRRR